jgi:adenylate cyclase
LPENERRLAAIMFTDMVGYTALGQRNESLALALLEEQRKVVRPILARHNGREVKTMGDAFLVEFPSALDAVRCAYDIQRATKEFNISMQEDRRIHLRVGVHLGDILESQGDISGDAVNVASRIESLAEDGGVCLSRQVYDHVQNKFELPLLSLGVQRMKGVISPLEVYKMVMPWIEEKIVSPTHVDKKRVAVLPLANLSPDQAEGFFADGMTEELITTLSKIREISVISRTSVMHYARYPKPLAEIAKDLRTGTILEGSVRKASNKIRITIQMIDALEDRNFWAETYDTGLEDIFMIQSDISRKVAQALRVQILGDEGERLQSIPTKDTGAHVLFLKGRSYMDERGQEATLKAKAYFEEAIKLDPRYALAYACLADCYYLLENWGFLAPEEAWPKVMEYASKALELDDAIAEAHVSMANALVIRDWDWNGSEREYKRALDLNPSYATAHHWYATLMLAQRRWAECLHQMEEAAKLDPFSEGIGTNLGWALFLAGRREEALKQFRSVLEMNPDFYYAHLSFGETLVSTGSLAAGILEIERAFQLGHLAEHKAALVYAYMAAGRKPEAEKAVLELTEMSRDTFVSNTWFSVAHVALGEKEKALERLEMACRNHDSSLLMSVNLPYFDALRTEPRFHESLRRIGLE